MKYMQKPLALANGFCIIHYYQEISSVYLFPLCLLNSISNQNMF
ncbi:hypothetical protein CHK_0569 [Christensenella hongkongensis]|uniref:Uncharacterized protein n=1 Tax=Christensenella hongkongensis TaxID=270498 RepID=A0A0M2NLN3_9FIRM|nr:hypothetical protein CHK_0569 [Christensenella hongkongensis]